MVSVPAAETPFTSGGAPAYVTITQAAPENTVPATIWRVVLKAGAEVDLRLQVNNRMAAGSNDAIFVKLLNVQAYVGLT